MRRSAVLRRSIWDRGRGYLFQDHSPLGRIVYGLARAMAIVGGLVLVAVVIMVTLSIIGRSLLWAGLRPIRGDYELSSAGVALAVFLFLPWAHLERGHAVVSLFTDRFGTRINAWILVITDTMMLVVAAFIAWRLYDGTLEKFAYHETTLLLRMPVGWGYATGLVGAVGFALIAVYVLGRSLTNAMTGRSEPKRMGGEI